MAFATKVYEEAAKAKEENTESTDSSDNVQDAEFEEK